MLRTLSLALTLLPVCVLAQTYEVSDEVRRTVNEATDQAEITAKGLLQRIELLKRDVDLPQSVPPTVVGALEHARVRDLLGVGDVSLGPGAEGDGQRYADGVFVFASFSMPGPALRQLLADAAELGVPVVFNGFVRNSAFETERVLRALYPETGTSHGFVIDPTLFARFDITAVPALVSTEELIDVCDTPGCAEDPTPPHDKVSGNIPLAAALRVIAEGNGDAPEPARAILETRP